ARVVGPPVRRTGNGRRQCSTGSGGAAGGGVGVGSEGGKEVDAPRAGARRRRRAGVAGRVSSRDPRRRGDIGAPMNIQQMMKQAQQMQERLQKQMAELKIEATAGGGMVTVVVNGAKQIQK